MSEKKFDELDQKIIEESARLYAEVYLEDEGLQWLTEAAIADLKGELIWDMLCENTESQRSSYQSHPMHK